MKRNYNLKLTKNPSINRQRIRNLQRRIERDIKHEIDRLIRKFK